MTLSSSLSTHVLSLMYVASLGYRWLKSDDISEEFLKTGEVTLLRVLFLASLRLYCHILTGDMKVCVCVCVRACVCACVRACVCVFVHILLCAVGLFCV